MTTKAIDRISCVVRRGNFNYWWDRTHQLFISFPSHMEPEIVMTREEVLEGIQNEKIEIVRGRFFTTS